MLGTKKSFRCLNTQMVALIVAGVVLSYSSASYAQCVGDKNSVDISGTDILRLQAATTMNDCASDRKAEVEAWISGMMTSVNNCQSGNGDNSPPGFTYNSSAKRCEVNKTGHTAVVTVAVGQCGPGTGLSNHYLWDPHLEIQVQRATSLSAPCTEQCPPPDYYWNGSECVFTPGSPLIISTNKQSKYELTSVQDGVLFDIDADGVPEQVAWTPPDSDIAFLALDRDGDGKITSGKELFGNYTLPGASNGYIALRMTALQTNGGISRGSVSSDDPVYERLLLWTDRNHNGFSESTELRHASEVLSEIGLSYKPMKLEDQYGNRFRFRGWAHLRTEKGRNKPKNSRDDYDRTIHIWDVYFKIQQ